MEGRRDAGPGALAGRRLPVDWCRRIDGGSLEAMAVDAAVSSAMSGRWTAVGALGLGTLAMLPGFFAAIRDCWHRWGLALRGAGAHRCAGPRPRGGGKVADLLEAVARRQGREVERLVLAADACPFEFAMASCGEWTSARALAERGCYEQALRFFDAVAKHGSKARFAHDELLA